MKLTRRGLLGVFGSLPFLGVLNLPDPAIPEPEPEEPEKGPECFCLSEYGDDFIPNVCKCGRLSEKNLNLIKKRYKLMEKKA